MPSPRSIHSLLRPGVASLLVVLAVAASAAIALPARAGDLDWPRQFDSPSGSFVIYEPQLEGLNGDVLTGRAAFSLRKSNDAHPTFGVLWYTEEIEINRDSDTVTVRNFEVTKVRLPEITSDEATRYATLVETEAAGWDLSGSLEKLQSGLAAAEQERASVAGIDNSPPKITFHDRRAILVVYDGAPALEPVEESKLERIVNTPYAVVFDPQIGYYYLNGANLWYRAKDPLGPWTNISSPPAAIREVVPPGTSADDQVEGTPPEVLTATEPTELIATDGAPRYAPLVGEELLYLTNTESDVVLEVSTQYLYVLISGRWFRSPSIDGPWTFVRGDKLPASFKQVPLDSPKGNVLASVAGTDQAEDAVADAEIPQTSAIQRGDRGFEVAYDGEPQFAPIEGTHLQYAVNTDAEVILADGRYYACDQGVWYISDDPYGPWSVSDTRPLGVEDIPPSSPVYDVRYVYIYDSTPDVVYVGYLPGYLGCYPYYGTVVYGTGYRYSSWRSRRHYYPRRFTWGFHARYNPWLSRWHFGLTYSSGFLRVGSRWRSGHQVAQSSALSKWFGAGGYRRVSEGRPTHVYNRPKDVARADRRLGRIPVRSIAPPIVRPAPVPDDALARAEWSRTKRPIPPPLTPPPTVQEPASRPSHSEVKRERKGRPAVEHPVPQRNNPPEQPTPPAEQSTPSRELPAPPPEKPAARPERPTPPAEQSTPPPEKPTPRDLERGYGARERTDRQEPQKERPSQRSKEGARAERNG